MKGNGGCVRKVTCGVLLLAGLVINARGYEIQLDPPVYRVILWKDGNPEDSVTIEGSPEKFDETRKAEHETCTIIVRKESKGKSLYWRIKVKPKGKWGVAEVQYPMLFFPELENDYLVVGRRVGQRYHMKFLTRRGDVMPGYAYRMEMRGVPDLFNKRCFFWARFPSGELTLQMIAYENGKEGCMLWTPDTEFWVKDFVLSLNDLAREKRGKGYRAYISHFPENTGQVGTGFDSPYPVVTTCYEGEWYVAAKIYRKWARKQWWCEVGKVYLLSTTPEWFKELQAWGGVAGRPGWVNSLLDRYKTLMKGRKAGYQWSNCWHYFNPVVTGAPEFFPAYNEAPFKKVLDRKKEGFYLAPYFLFSVIVQEHKPVWEKLKEGVVRNADGSLAITYPRVNFEIYLNRDRKEIPRWAWERALEIRDLKEQFRKAWKGPIDEELLNWYAEFPSPPGTLDSQLKALRKNWGKDTAIIDRLPFYSPSPKMCLGDKKYLDYCVNEVHKAVERYKLDMIYLDTFPHSPMPCYNRLHNHPLGHGRHIARGNYELVDAILKLHPKLIIACESGAGEYLFGKVHLTYHKGISPVYAIPFFPIVYNGYIIYTNWWMWPPYETDDDFASMLAFGTHLGYLPGGAVAGGLITQFARQPPLATGEKKLFFLRTLDMWDKYRWFLAVGEQLPPPKFTVKDYHTHKWYGKTGKYYSKITLPRVQFSVWRDQHRSKILYLYSNDSTNPSQCKVKNLTFEVPALSWSGSLQYIDQLLR